MNAPDPYERFVVPEGVHKVTYERDMKVMNAATVTVEREDHTVSNVIRMEDTFADIHNLDQCISYLNQSLVTFGFPSGLNLFSNEPASIVQTCNCFYALIQQRQQDIEYRLTADETRLRLTSDMTKLEAKVELLTDQLASKEREMLATGIKGSGSYQEVLANVGVAARSSQHQSQPLRHDENGTDVGGKAKLDNKMRHWQDIKPKTPIKAVPPRSPLPPKSPAHNRLCPFSPPTQSVKRILGADCAFTTPRSRFSEQAGMKVPHFDVSTTAQRNNERLKKSLNFELKKPMDAVQKSVTSTSEEQIVQCSGSLKLPDENIFLSPLIQYDNPIYQEESPPLSERVKTLELNMRALSPISVNVEHLQRSSQVLSPWKSNVSRMNLEFEKLTYNSPEREAILNEQLPSTGTPDIGSAETDPSTSGSLTPFQQLKNPDFQKTLVKQYLTALNTATREELLELKGIGPKRAAVILELRQHSDEPFKDLQDLKNIGLNERQAHSLFDCNIVKKVVLPAT